MAMTLLLNADCVQVGGKPKLVSLTIKGSRVKHRYEARLGALVERWREQYGAATMDALQLAVDALVAQPEALTQGLVPYPGAWRGAKPYRYQTDAVLADPFGALPHHPMVLHRGGYPDGS